MDWRIDFWTGGLVHCWMSGKSANPIWESGSRFAPITHQSTIPLIHQSIYPFIHDSSHPSAAIYQAIAPVSIPLAANPKRGEFEPALSYHSAHPPHTNPPIQPSKNQSINPSIHQSINPSIHQSINPSIHQSINPLIHQSTNPFQTP
jgi:hypothetical protein